MTNELPGHYSVNEVFPDSKRHIWTFETKLQAEGLIKYLLDNDYDFSCLEIQFKPFLPMLIGKYFVFPKENNISWIMDFTGHPNNIPGDVKFELKEFLNKDTKRTILTAPGYGGIPYGNGSICVDFDEIKEFIIREINDY